MTLLPASVPYAGAAVETECDWPAFERCYAILESDVGNYGGDHHTVVRDGLTYNPNEMFIISTMWVAMSDGWWVEAGYGEGNFICGASTNPRWYTAHYNATGYQETCINAISATPGTSYQVTIERSSSPTTNWLVKINGAVRYTHTSMKTLSTALNQGVEANHWATRLLDAWHSGYRHRLLVNWAPPVWPNPYETIIGAPSAHGDVTAPYAVWVHGFWGV